MNNLKYTQIKLNMKRLYLDDIKTPINPEWIVARNYDEFVKIVNKKGLENFDIISLDHDLGESHDGMDCALFLINKCLDLDIQLPQIFVHSENTVGGENIIKLINNWHKFNDLDQKCELVKIPFKEL